MRRALLLAGMAVWLFSCSDRGNEQGQETNTTPIRSDPRDTVNIGIGAGANEQTNNAAGDASGTGAPGSGGASTGGNTGTSGAGSAGSDTSRTRGQRQ